jgi:plasmid stabilization system protein ParE
MSRAAPATEAELRAAFDELIAGPTDGRSDVPTDTGLDDQTVAAIERAWSAAGSTALAELARQELELQIDGTHAREAQDAQDAVVADVAAQYLGPSDPTGQPGIEPQGAAEPPQSPA